MENNRELLRACETLGFCIFDNSKDGFPCSDCVFGANDDMTIEKKSCQQEVDNNGDHVRAH